MLENTSAATVARCVQCKASAPFKGDTAVIKHGPGCYATVSEVRKP